ncbi:MAG: PEGA domain-containing protein, partial [Polyangiales bacterium]
MRNDDRVAGWVAGWVATTLILGQVTVASGAPVAKEKTVVEKAPKKVVERLEGAARKHYEAGASLYEVENYEGALTEYRAAYDLSKEPRVLRAVAVCQKDLRRYSEAVASLDKLLADAKDLEPEFLEKVTADRAVLLPLTGLVTIEVSEPGAEVSVDGRVIGTSPLTGEIRVDVGERVFTAKKPAWIDFTSRVSVVGGDRASVKLALEPIEKKGHLKITVSGLPVGVVAKLTLDDASITGPPFEGDVLAGHHVVEVSAPGYSTYKVAKEIVYKGNVDVDVKLEQERHDGTLSVDTGDAKTTISVDGKVVGGGTWTATVPSGAHSVLVTRDGYKPFRSEVTVLDHQQRSV